MEATPASDAGGTYAPVEVRLLSPALRGRGEVGRRTRSRAWWAKTRGGSSPPDRTTCERDACPATIRPGMLSKKIRRELASHLRQAYEYAAIAYGYPGTRGSKLGARLNAYVAAAQHADQFNELVQDLLADPRVEGSVPFLYFPAPEDLKDSNDLHRSSLKLIDELQDAAEEIQVDAETGKLLD